MRGCACQNTSFDGWHNRKSSISVMGLLSLQAPAARGCLLRLEHRQHMGVKGWGSKVKVLAVITPPFTLDLSDRDLRTFQGSAV